MKVLSLFDGISCGMVALERAGIPVERYVAYEIEPNAIKISKKNYPQIEHCGDVTASDFTQYEGFDLLIGGSPCQGFSIVNKHKKENDERNDLYKFYVHAVNQSRPKVFLMENVEGILKIYDGIRKDFEHVGYIVCDPLILSPKDFGFPQSRKRVFVLGVNED